MKRFLFLLFFLANSCLLFAQTTTVKGVVSSSTGEPLPGVTINHKGTKNTTVSGKDGSYTITTASNAVLVFSFIGYTRLEERVGNRSVVDVALTSETKDMDEVVVVGYGTSKRKDITGAVSSVSGKELAKIPVQNPAQALQGRIAGMQVSMPDGTPGSSPSIIIRGGGSITQSNEPLYVVDGVPQTDGLNFLDAMDIESVDILKDASATAIYGARGANGVILITTKQIKPGKMTVNYDGFMGAKKITSTLPVLNPYQYTLMLYERAATDAVRLPAFVANYGPYDSLQYYYANKPGIDWQKEVFGEIVKSQYHKISINGGSKETKFNLFYSRNNDEGIMKESGSTKNVAKLSLNHSINKKFTVNAIVNYSNQKITGVGTQEGGNARLSMLQTLLQYRPTIGRNGNDDALTDYEIDPLDPNPSSPAFQSPLVKVQTQHRQQTINTLNANATIRYNFVKNLTYSGIVNYTAGNTKFKEFNEASSLWAIRTGGATAAVSHNINNRFNFSNTLSYNNVFAKLHKLDLTAGQEYLYNYNEGISVSATGLPVSNLGWDRLQMATIPGFPTTFAEDDKLLSFFGRANYAFNGKYLLTTTVRYDGSSKFGSENQWGIFPSVAVAWRVISEKFMEKLPAFSDLKLRLSYGEAGNNRIANYAALGVFTSGVYPLNNQVVSTVSQNNLANPFLKWEATKSANIGLDIGLLRQRISLTTELYENRSKDLLFETRIPASSGFTKQFQNIGTTSSRGIEFTLNTVNIRNADLTWNTNFNIAFNRTKVLSLSEGETSLLTKSYTDANDYILRIGQPVGMMYGYIKEGLYQVNDFDFNSTNSTYTLKAGVVRDNYTVQPGFIKYKDISGPDGKPDGLINDFDRTIIGNANPKYSGGINNTVSYKGIDLSVFLNFVVGNNIYNANVLNNSRLDEDYKNTLAVFANRWTSINAQGQRVTDPVELAALNVGKTMPVYNGLGGVQRLHNEIIEDGSFLRINNISLGYTFPKSWMRRAKISNARIYVTAYNLHVFTKYSGYDPEVSVIRTALTPGVDFSAYPRAKSIVAGLSLSL